MGLKVRGKSENMSLLACLICSIGFCFTHAMEPNLKNNESSMRTIEITSEKAQEGKALFMTCTACHGMEGEGKVGMGPRLNSRSFLAAASDQFLYQTIAEGRTGTTMIAWKNSYTQNQIEAMIAYLRTLNPAPPAQLDNSVEKGSEFHGKAVYDSICASCHGKSGAGYMETANGTGIMRKAFLDAADNGFLRYIIKNGKDATMMKSFAEGSKVAVADLSDKEVEDVITYLRRNAW